MRQANQNQVHRESNTAQPSTQSRNRRADATVKSRKRAGGAAEADQDNHQDVSSDLEGYQAAHLTIVSIQGGLSLDRDLKGRLFLCNHLDGPESIRRLSYGQAIDWLSAIPMPRKPEELLALHGIHQPPNTEQSANSGTPASLGHYAHDAFAIEAKLEQAGGMVDAMGAVLMLCASHAPPKDDGLVPFSEHQLFRLSLIRIQINERLDAARDAAGKLKEALKEDQLVNSGPRFSMVNNTMEAGA